MYFSSNHSDDMIEYIQRKDSKHRPEDGSSMDFRPVLLPLSRQRKGPSTSSLAKEKVSFSRPIADHLLGPSLLPLILLHF
jgi:hypothetical protein